MALAESDLLLFDQGGEVHWTGTDELLLTIGSGPWSVASASFGAPALSDLYWVTRSHSGHKVDGFALFVSRTFKVRCSPSTRSRYLSLNNSYSKLRQNFTVPASMDGFEVRYIWVVVKVGSGWTGLHCEIEDHGAPSTVTDTQTVNITGPYDWWIALKLTSPRKLHSGEEFDVRIVWELGADPGIHLMDNVTNVDDYATGDAQLFNTSSSSWIRQTGWMTMCVMAAAPDVNDYSLTLPPWLPQIQLGTYWLHLHGRNLPAGRLSVLLNSVTFGHGYTPAIFPYDPMSEVDFAVPVSGFGSFSGENLRVVTNLDTIEQSRSSYDADHPPPFFRPFSKLVLYTDEIGQPWGEWSTSSAGWSVAVKDQKWVWHSLPAEDISEQIYDGQARYRIRVDPPSVPSIGFLTYKLGFSWEYWLAKPGPLFETRYWVHPTYVSWQVLREGINTAAPPHSSLKFLIEGVPEDWAISSFCITSGPGGGTPFAKLENSSLEIGGILLGPSPSYTGNASVTVQASNYLNTPHSKLLLRLGTSEGTFFIVNDNVTLETKASSALGATPAGDVYATLTGPSGEVFSVLASQPEDGVASAGPFTLLQVGSHNLVASFTSADGLRVGAKSVQICISKFWAGTDRPVVGLSSPLVEFLLVPSEPSSVGLAWVVVSDPSGTERRVGLAFSNSSFTGSWSVSTQDPSVVGEWVTSFWVNFPDGSDRLVGTETLLIIDDLPPVIENVTTIPAEPSMFDDVDIFFSVQERGSGLNRTWVAYTTWAGQRETIVEANSEPGGWFKASIPRQLPFAQVHFWVWAQDLSDNTSSSGPLSYSVGVPTWLTASAIIVMALAAAVYLRRKAKA